jgi:two-component system, NarL family, invasion response regulator UvrY
MSDAVRESDARGGVVADESTTIRVMIVDDQQPFRAAARAVVERVAGFELVAEVESGEEAVQVAAEATPQLVLMDINMGELDGIEATRLITGSDPTIRVVLVSTYTLDDLPPTARTSGAIAYVNKDELSPRVIRRLWEAGGDPDWLASVPPTSLF